MQDIKEIVNNKVAEMDESGEIKKSIEDGVKAAIDRAISEQFESWGNITKQLEEVFNEKLNINKNSLNIPCYNAVMEGVINQQINEFFKGQAAERMKEMIKSKLAPLPDEMPLNDFVSMICKEWFVDDFDSRDEVDDYATVEISTDSRSCLRGTTLKMWKKKESDSLYSSTPNGPDIHLYISENGTILGDHAKDPYYVFDADALIFKAYAQGVKLTGLDDFDEDDCELSLKDGEY